MNTFVLPTGPALATLATVLLLFLTAANVGRARGKYRVAAPATSGHPQFDIAFRIQMNTIEGAMMFLPALWICALAFSAQWATALAGLWLVGRVGYALAYTRSPKTRGGG
ncbi:MAG: MAPEG family protein, partial [bacterium]